MIGPIKGRIFRVCLFRGKIDMIDKEPLKKFV